MSWLNFPVSQLTTRASSTVVLLTALLVPLPFAYAAVPNYKLGDVALEDVITPVPLVVPHPEATDAFKQKVAQQAPTIVRFTPGAAAEAEAELRASVATARTKFLTALDALLGRPPVASDVGTPEFKAAVAYALNNSSPLLPLEKLSTFWVRGENEEPFIRQLLTAVWEVMSAPILADGETDAPLPDNPSVRLIPVKSFSEPVTIDRYDTAGETITPDRFVSLTLARRQVETSFPAGEEPYGKFAASFVRANSYYDPSLTAIVRAQRTVGFTVNDTFEAAQVVVHKGQTIDRKALSALAVLREKSLIGTLQSKLEQEQTVAGQIESQTKWIVTGLGAMALTLLLILWRLRTRPTETLIPAFVGPALPGSAQAALPGGAGDGAWQNRALLAEGKAERAHEAIRSGVLGWMRDKIFRTMADQRAELLSAQKNAESEMRELEQRLEQLQAPLQERISTYEKRIEELEKELAAKLKAQESAPPTFATSEDADRHARRREVTLAERERDIGEAKIRLADQARDLDEMAALLRAREALLASAPSRPPSNGRVKVRGAEPLIQIKN